MFLFELRNEADTNMELVETDYWWGYLRQPGTTEIS